MSVRSFNCLKRAGIDTVEDLVNKTEEGNDEGQEPRQKVT